MLMSVCIKSDSYTTCNCTIICSLHLKAKQQIKLFMVNMRTVFAVIPAVIHYSVRFIVYAMRTVHKNYGYRTITICISLCLSCTSQCVCEISQAIGDNETPAC